MKLRGVTQKFYKFLYVFFGFVDASDVRKGGFDLILRQQAGFGLAKGHWPTTTTAATLHLTHEQHKYGNNDEDWEARNQQLRPNTLFFRQLALHNYIGVVEVINQLVVG